MFGLLLNDDITNMCLCCAVTKPKIKVKEIDEGLNVNRVSLPIPFNENGR